MNKTYVSVCGFNQDRLLSVLHGERVALFDIEKQSPKKMTFAVLTEDEKKVFAILSDLCYNGTVIKRTGSERLRRFLKRRWGALVGALAFVLIAGFSGGVILTPDYGGDAAAYSEQMGKALADSGVVFPAFAFSTDFRALETELLRKNDWLSFVSVKKRGSRLLVTAYLAKTHGVAENEPKAVLLSPVDGVLTRVKAYRGTAVKAVGETVSAGDKLIDGFTLIRGECKAVTVSGEATVLTSRTFSYFDEEDGKEDAYAAFALSEKGGAYESVTAKKTAEKDGFRYDITITYSVTVYAT